ncbi:MAG: NAD(P)-dependent oxidoreductase [Chthoniobacterales bacterium]|nr:NAD(P)-dependent oxidoreductase [Chthoniobacterales bacterium]
MKILLFGAAGLLGRYLVEEFSRHSCEFAALTHKEADITDARRLDALFDRPWDVVINAAAVCDFDACQRDPLGTGLVNRDAPLDIARRCEARGALFVQFSSDYIFAGDGAQPLTEEDAPHPLSVYGDQKAALEKEIPLLCPRSLVLRLSWLYGVGGRTFMSSMPSLLASQPVLRTAAGKKGSCLYAADGALWTRRLIESGATGLFNVVNAGETSWEEFARTCLEIMGSFGLAPACRTIEEIPYEKLGPEWSKRPRYSCLAVDKLASLLPPGPRRWEKALEAFLADWKSFAPAGGV